MLKLPKGLKKKKKGKKSKKDQELFTEEELAQYKREHQVHQEEEQPQPQQQEQPQNQEGGGDDDEWKKFAALTTGIDSILKKTQGDLNRIKTTSFFQRVAPPKEEKKQVEVKEELEEATAAALEEEVEKDPVKALLNAVVELSDSDEDSEVDDTAFDTTFIEKVETGEIPVYYIPEEEEEIGPDPFDTGYADKVITGPDVSKRGKKIVNIGAAVGVLTGKVETTSTTAKSRRQRRGIQNLLLESFELEQEENPDKPLEAQQISPPKTLLDEPAELSEDIPIDLSVSLHLALLPPKEKHAEEEEEGVLDEFDVIKRDDIDVFVTDTVPKQEVDNTDWSEFELDRAQFPSRPPPPVRPPLPQKQNSDDNDDFDLGIDPFDTEYVEKIVPKPIDYDEDFDPRGAEEEEDDFNPRAQDENLFDSQGKPAVESLSLARNDLLSASHSDLASIAPTLAPSAEEEQEEIDPFDTSAVDKLVAPGKAELKFLEKELLEQNKESLSDDDFDPRAEEEHRPSIEELRHRKSSLSLQIAPKLVSFHVPTPDLLKVESEASSKIQKPLTPYYNQKSSLSLEEEAVEEDPFDTSFVPKIAPTRVELDLIEREILKQEPATLKHSLSDPDFDPRAITPIPEQSDLYLAPDNHDIKVLTPAKESSPEDIEVDPFDTSIAANIVPGKIELQLLEDELIERKPEALQPTDLISDTQDNSIYSKILTPQPTGSLDLDANQEDFDPFDTSFAGNLAPGETELQLLENELIN